MRRREFMTLVGGAAVWPLGARAQQPGKLPTIGFLGTATASAWSDWIAPFVQRLHELGWIENRSISIEFRWAEGRAERYAEIAAEFVRMKVDVIVTSGGAVLALKQATSTIPIIFGIAADPVGDGLVSSLARPGGNATGLSSLSADLAGKRLELLREVVKGLRSVAVMANATYPASVLEVGQVQTFAAELGLEFVALEIRRAEDIASVFGTLRGRAQALYVVGDPLATTNRVRINTLALGERLPTMHAVRHFVEAGGLMSYGPSFADQFRRAADLTDKVLRGTNPSDIPVEQPTKFELIVNSRTAKALGLEISPTLLARADEVIE